jgi:hypothetical protein
VCTDQVEQALDLPVTPVVPIVSLPCTDQVLSPSPTTPSAPLPPPGPPLAPGGPSSLIENAFARRATTAASLPINNTVPGDENIDLGLLDMANHAPANYHLPGAVVDHGLATLVDQGPRKKRAPPRKKGQPKANAESPQPRLASQKHMAAGATKKSVESTAGSGRKRTARLNPNGEVFKRPKKRSHA